MKYSLQIKTERMAVVGNHLNNAIVQIYSIDNKLLVEIELSNPAVEVGSGVLNLSGTPQGIAISGGKAEYAKILEKDLKTIAIEDIIVGKDEGNIKIDNDIIEVNQIVKLNSGSIIHG